MAKPWREFEKFVARIERAMAPSGAVVKSPDKIADNLTGELREVDASVRYKVGTSNVLITIECRNRSSVEDVRWIEQIVEKKRSIGASITVAVSSSGFSEPAIKKASASGIEIRTLTDATAGDFVQWLKVQNVLLDANEWSFVGLALELYDAPSDAELTPDFLRVLREDGHHALIFIRNSDGKRFHIENMLIELQKRNPSIFGADLPPDGTKMRRNLHQPFDRKCLYVETTKGNFDIRVMHIDLLVSRTKTLVPVSKLKQYSDPASPLVQTAEWILLENINLSLHRDLKSGETKVAMTWPVAKP
jgi:hypothetical protein